MKIIKVLPLITLVGLVGCSTAPKHTHTHRTLASVNEIMSSQAVLNNRMERLMSGIFHGHLMGQIFLHDFDKQLDKSPNKALKSKTYMKLLSIRTHVDQFEHDFNDLYIDLVLATALPQYSEIQKQNAQEALDTFGKFYEGVKRDNKALPENLKPMILGNLREKITELYDELKELRDDESVTNNDPAVKEVLWKNMAKLRATRLSYFKEVKNYKVDEKLLQETIKAEKAKDSYKNLESSIQNLSEEIREYTSEIGRDTSSDTITPSAGKNGNISGQNFPAKTWSLTYDDGPGATTPDVIKNLQEKKIPATFFVLAQQVEKLPKTALSLKEAGFDIASHSYTHAQLTKEGVNLEREIGSSKKTIETKLDTKVKLFRLPYGAGVSVARVRQKIADHGMIHVFWTVDTLDWQDKNPTSIYNRTLKQMNASSKNAGIVLFHDIHKQSVTASSMLMDYFNQKKLTVCTVQGVVDQMNGVKESCK
ncbi:polysaccharide deacetylase family protein [Peredibacter starrii]|uniref:Polysaccharide deacetylase family protein n=1 Tax=Peredibacter starrii TaxID=28202 RepID=A0AAX4HL89_9BACT|nr:polysaccharide deacetylase family protein [Peredibacter starrii]WPU63996.1 polysaccharide deacetylase family protein [Peredibacter starrii]